MGHWDGGARLAPGWHSVAPADRSHGANQERQGQQSGRIRHEGERKVKAKREKGGSELPLLKPASVKNLVQMLIGKLVNSHFYTDMGTTASGQSRSPALSACRRSLAA